MSATLYTNSHLKDFPFSLRWVTASTRPVFDSIIFSFVGLPVGDNVTYQGPLAAWLEFQAPGSTRWVQRYLMVDVVYGNSKTMTQLTIQAKVQLSEPITVSAGSPIILHFATPLTAQIPTESTSSASTAWDVRYGLRGRFV